MRLDSGQAGFLPRVSSINMWVRRRDVPLVVSVAWEDPAEGWGDEMVWGGVSRGLLIKGRVMCTWSEYESGMVGLPQVGQRPRIPAYEEVLRYLPQWTVSRGVRKELVEVWGDFTFGS